jgi:hypothetical protein
MPRAAQFSPGVIDYDGPMSASYHSGRALSAEAASTWCATAAPFLRAAQCARVLRAPGFSERCLTRAGSRWGLA